MENTLEAKNEQTFTKRIGSTTYKVFVHFDKAAGVTAADRIMHLIQNDLITGNHVISSTITGTDKEEKGGI